MAAPAHAANGHALGPRADSAAKPRPPSVYVAAALLLLLRAPGARSVR